MFSKFIDYLLKTIDYAFTIWGFIVIIGGLFLYLYYLR